MGTKRRQVKAFFEVPVKGRSKPAIVPREAVMETPSLMDAVDADLRGKLLVIIEDAEGLKLDRMHTWWTVVAAAVRMKAAKRAS